MVDHDQLFKSLLMEFPREFFELFFPEWAARFDFSHIEWLLQEVFPNPPDGKRRAIDLVAKLPLRENPGKPKRKRRVRQWLALIHIEFESGTRIAAFQRRFFWYYANLTQRHRLPLLPVVLCQSAPLGGVGEHEYVESFGPLDVIRFRYLAVGFPRLDAEEWIQKPNPLAPGLVALMQVREERQAWLKAEAARRIVRDNTTHEQKHLLMCCLDRYLTLSESQASEYNRMIQAPELAEVKAMNVTTYEKGIEKGIEKGLEKGRAEGRSETLRRIVLIQLEKRFDPLSRKVRKLIEKRSADELEAIAERLVTAESLADLGL